VNKHVFLTLLIASLVACELPTHQPQNSRCKADKPCWIPMVFALANPTQLHAQNVAIHGYLRRSEGGIALFTSRETALHSDHASSITVEPASRLAASVDSHLNAWVTVTGEFVDERNGVAWASIKNARIGPSSIWSDSPPPSEPRRN
jgi:hypothetical protein